MGMAEASMVGRSRRQLGPPRLETLEKLRSRHHGGCLACNHPMFRLEFDCDRDEGLVARFLAQEELCSYRGVIHGGVVALLFDEAMTCCLMAHGAVAVTGDLKLRYVAPVKSGELIEIRSRVARTLTPLYHVESRMCQAGATKATATGRFLQQEEGEQ